MLSTVAAMKMQRHLDEELVSINAAGSGGQICHVRAVA
jgi:hypothetical protein